MQTDHFPDAQLQADRDAELDRLAEEFLAAVRAGHNVEVEEYAAQHGEFAAEIRQLFPALLELEDLGEGGLPGPFDLSRFGASQSLGLTNSLRKYSPSNAEFESLDNSVSGQSAGWGEASSWQQLQHVRSIGEFEIVRPLGKGGMGVVFLARQPKLNRSVALKILPNFWSASPDLKRRFDLEATATAQMQHAHIVPLFESGQAAINGDVLNQVHYLAMRYVPGRSLDRIVAEQITATNATQTEAPVSGFLAAAQDQWSGRSETERASRSETQIGTTGKQTPGESAAEVPFDISMGNRARWRLIARAGAEVAEALAHAHDKEILHRDIKPSNLIVDSTGKTWVADFGLAKFMALDTTDTDGVAGTLRFMAPERFRDWADPRSDVYSLGITLFELATLRKAREETDRSRLIADILRQDLDRPSQCVAGIPADFETIILKATDREPSRRYESAAALRDDLYRFCDRRPILARRAGPLTQLYGWCVRNRPTAMMGVATFCLLVLFSLFTGLASLHLSSLASERDAAKIRAERNLLSAYIDEAQSRTRSGRPGQRTAALDSIRKATTLLPGVDHTAEDVLALRNEAIAAMLLPDMTLDTTVDNQSQPPISSPNGRYYAWSDNNAKLHLAEVHSGQEVWSYKFGYPTDVSWVIPIFSPNSEYVFGYSDNIDKWRLFRTETGEVVLELAISRLNVNSPIGYDPNSKWLAVPDAQRTIRIFNLQDLSQPPRRIEVPFRVNQVMFATDTRFVAHQAFTDETRLVVHDLATDEQEVIETGYESITAAAATADGLLIAHTHGKLTAHVWDDFEHPVYELQFKNTIGYVRVHRELGLAIVAQWSEACQVIETATGRRVFTQWARGASFTNRAVAFGIESQLQFFGLSTGENCLKSAHLSDDNEYLSPQVSPDCRLLIANGDSAVKLYDAATLELLDSRHLEIHGQRAAVFLSDREVVSISGGKLVLSRLNGNKLPSDFANAKVLADTAGHGCISVACKPRKVAWRSTDQTIHVADPDDVADSVTITPRSAGITFLPFFALSPDGSYLAVTDGTVRIFDGTNGELLHDFGRASSGEFRASLAFSPDSQCLVCFSGTEHMIFDLEKKQLVRRIPGNGYRCGAAWSCDGSMLAVVTDQETIRLLDSDDYSEIAALRTPEEAGIQTIQFVPDDSAIVGAVGREQLYRWDLIEIRRELQELGLDW